MILQLLYRPSNDNYPGSNSPCCNKKSDILPRKNGFLPNIIPSKKTPQICKISNCIFTPQLKAIKKNPTKKLAFNSNSLGQNRVKRQVLLVQTSLYQKLGRFFLFTSSKGALLRRNDGVSIKKYSHCSRTKSSFNGLHWPFSETRSLSIHYNEFFRAKQNHVLSVMNKKVRK